MNLFDSQVNAVSNLRIARTKAWRTANPPEDIGSASEDRFIIPRDFNPDISKAWDAFDASLNEMNSKKDNLPSLECQSENDVVFVTFKFEKSATQIYDR